MSKHDDIDHLGEPAPHNLAAVPPKPGAQPYTAAIDLEKRAKLAGGVMGAEEEGLLTEAKPPVGTRRIAAAGQAMGCAEGDPCTRVGDGQHRGGIDIEAIARGCPGA